MSYIKVLISVTILMLTIRTLVDCNCSILNIENGGVDNPTPTEGTRAKILCDPGYTLEDQAVIFECKQGVWVSFSGAARRRRRSPSAISTCRKICGYPNITNGDIGKASTAFRNESVSVICNQGFAVDGQPDTIMCEASGSWSPSPLPSCQKLCGQPNIMNGSISNASMVHTNESVVVICNEGFSLDGQSDLIMCQSDGVWSLLPNCSLITAAPTTEYQTTPEIIKSTTTPTTTTTTTTTTTKTTTKTTKSSLPSSTIKKNTGEAGAPTTTADLGSACTTIRPTGIAIATLFSCLVLIYLPRLE